MAGRKPSKSRKARATATGLPLTRTLFGRLLAPLAQLAAAWMALAAAELALSAAIPATALRQTELAAGARIGLTAYGLALVLVVVSIVGVPLLALARWRRPGTAKIPRIAAGSAHTVIVFAAVLLYAVSWAVFSSTGVFLDREAFIFWLPEPVQVFHWVYPPLAITVLGAALLSALVLGWGLPRWVRGRTAAFQRRLVWTAAAAAASCAGLAFGAEAVYGPQAAGADGSKSRYVTARESRTSPLLHAVADIRGQLAPLPPQLPAATGHEANQIIRRPIVSLERYLGGVDRGRVKPWNVVMIQIESLRSDQLRAYGGTRDVMPNLDALGRRSTVFTNAYVQASHSNYADLVPLSSHYPLRYPQMYVYPEEIPYPRVLVYELLKGLGYKTAIVSSQNEVWGGMVNYHRPSSLDTFFHAATFSGPTYVPWEDLGFAKWVQQTRSAGSVDDRYTVDAAMQWIDETGDAPFFLHMNLQSSHLPYVVPKGFRRPFGRDTLDFAIVWGSFPVDKVDAVKDRYADSLFYEDVQIGRLLEHLQRRGHGEDTIIVVGGDNGEAFYEHGFSAHASWVFNEVMKVPMVIHVPGRAPARDDRPAMFLDVPPSILDLLGLPPHPGFQGISLFAPGPDRDRPVFMMAQTVWAHQVAMVRSGYKLLFNESDGGYLLFDLARDPGETSNIGASRRDLFDRMNQRLQRWRTEQLAYYADAGRQAREYPPVIDD